MYVDDKVCSSNEGKRLDSSTSQRPALYIAGSRRSPDTTIAHSPFSLRKRTLFVHASAAILLVAIVIGVFLAVLPTNNGIAASSSGKIFQPSTSMVTARQDQPALIVAQGATATAVTQDGYEYRGAGGKYSWPGVKTNFTLPDGTTTGPANNTQAQPAQQAPTQPAQPVQHYQQAPTPVPVTNAGSSAAGTTTGISSSTGTIADSSFNNFFTPGQCTYWADYEYHHLTGYAVPWSGNAADWAANASGYSGWVVSSQPRVPSIIVLQPGTQYAGWAGHVAVVEKINSDGSLATTDWNVQGWGVFSWETYHSGPGVSFIWHN
ncbi:CHAP domain-containing protein [Ktedonobacteria bacterium brp13]|nr:CHAP domain-containing protein [Ktedonobacteria bacterium brp13]